MAEANHTHVAEVEAAIDLYEMLVEYSDDSDLQPPIMIDDERHRKITAYRNSLPRKHLPLADQRRMRTLVRLSRSSDVEKQKESQEVAEEWAKALHARYPTIQEANPEDDPSGSAVAAVRDITVGFLGGTELANALGIHSSRRDAFLRQLERKRRVLGDDAWQEVSEPRPNTPRFLYRVNSPKLREVAAQYRGPKSK